MSELRTTLEAVLAKGIDKICPNKVHDLTANHCAHFVSHMTGLDFSFNCVEFKGGTKQPANVRVHEIFERCPKVGKFADADKTKTQLVFVTRKGRPDPAEPLHKDAERPGRDMPVLERSYHVLDRADLGWGQSMGRRVRTGRLIVKRTRVLQASPGMEPTRDNPGTAGVPAAEQTHEHDLRLAGS